MTQIISIQKYCFQKKVKIPKIINKESRMIKNDDIDKFYSFKCGLCSFVATYISGVMHPFDLIKTRFQSHDGRSNAQNLVPKYSGVMNAVKEIYKSQGLLGLYKGFYISMLSQAMSISFFFWMYEKRKLFYENKSYELMDAVTFASIEASICATFITQPFWVIKTRMLLDVNRDISEVQNFIQKTKEIYQQNGMRGFGKGLLLSFILSFSGVIQMYIYEASKVFYDYANLPQSGLQEKNFICGSISKAWGVMMTYPITTLRTRIQQNQFFGNRNDAKYHNVFQIMGRMLREEGVRGFYKGLWANLIRGIPQKGIYFYAYQLLKKLIIKDERREA